MEHFTTEFLNLDLSPQQEKLKVGSKEAQEFLKRVALVEPEDLLTNADFEMFKSLGFKLIEREYLASNSALTPSHWDEVFTLCGDFGSVPFQKLISCLLDLNLWNTLEKSELASVLLLDAHLGLCEVGSDDYSLKFLSYLNAIFFESRFSNTLLQCFPRS